MLTLLHTVQYIFADLDKLIMHYILLFAEFKEYVKAKQILYSYILLIYMHACIGTYPHNMNMCKPTHACTCTHMVIRIISCMEYILIC